MVRLGRKRREENDTRVWIRGEEKGRESAVNVYRINTLVCVLQVLSYLLLVYGLLT
jgi:hypothetical protein